MAAVAVGAGARDIVVVVDQENHRVLLWRAGEVEGEVVAGGNGRGSRLDQLNYPQGVVVERDGSLLVDDHFNDRVVRWRAGAREGEVVGVDVHKAVYLTQWWLNSEFEASTRRKIVFY